MGQGEEDVSVHLVGENGISMSGLAVAKPRVGLAISFAFQING